MKRDSKFWVVVALVALTGCGSNKSPDVPDLDDLSSHASVLMMKIESVKDAQYSLKRTADEFSYTDWKTVVPDMEDAVQDMAEAVEELERAASIVRSDAESLKQQSSNDEGSYYDPY